MITHAFDVAVVNSWLEYRGDKERQGTRPQQIMDLLDFKNECGRSSCARGEAPRIEKTREAEQFQHTQSMYKSNSS